MQFTTSLLTAAALFGLGLNAQNLGDSCDNIGTFYCINNGVAQCLGSPGTLGSIAGISDCNARGMTCVVDVPWLGACEFVKVATSSASSSSAVIATTSAYKVSSTPVSYQSTPMTTPVTPVTPTPTPTTLMQGYRARRV